jgi:hypothetical protein
MVDLLLSARQSVTLYNAMPEEVIGQALLTTDISASFIWAAAVRYLGYRGAGDTPSAVAISREVHTRLNRRPAVDHPLLREIATILQALDDQLVFTFQQPWRSVYLPAVVTLPKGRSCVLIPEEGLFSEVNGNPEYDRYLAGQLQQAGFQLSFIDTTAWWEDSDTAARSLLNEWQAG